MAVQKKKRGRPPASAGKNKKSGKSAAGARSAQSRGMDPNVKDDIWAVILIAAGCFLAVAFQTHAAGAVGEGMSDFFKGCFGMIAYALPYYLMLYGILLLTKKTIHIGRKAILLLFIILLTASIINSARFIDPQALEFSAEAGQEYYRDGIKLDSGGAVGMYIGSLLVKAFGIPGLYIISILIIAICMLLIINTPVSRFFEKAAQRKREREEIAFLEEEESERKAEYRKRERQEKERPANPVERPKKKRVTIRERLAMERSTFSGSSYTPGKISQGQRNILAYMQDETLFSEEPSDSGFGLDGGVFPEECGEEKYGEAGGYPEEAYETAVQNQENFEEFEEPEEKESPREESPAEPLSAADDLKKDRNAKKMTGSQAAGAVLTPQEINKNSVASYKFPSISLLNKGKAAQDPMGRNISLREKAIKLEETLHNFNIDAEVVKVTQGPAVTRYEIHPNVGVKVKSIVNLADDIALNLAAKSIRIEAPIPGKAAVGIEVENDKVTMVTIREIIDSKEFKNAESKISFAVGKDIAGNAIVGDLKGMPHLLIAGSTGSGKSVCVNSIITSILYKAKPEEVKLVLIDPKVVELTNYNGIPHLLIPVVTEPSKAAAALNWAVAEMEERYNKFAKEGVRDLKGYNKTVTEKGEEDLFLPQVVIIIDELADLMMAAPSQVEESICRLAQKARAAGMHLIVATQRPSVDVITGVIKANIPSRIAFAVSSQFDSRTILDMAGAEKLVGKGDMLFNPMGGGKPIRVQGTFISDSEVHDVIEFIKGQVEETGYADDVIHTIEKANTPQDAGDADELLPKAIDLVVSSQQASASMLQRQLRVGYNRAARMVDMMEARGIIGPPDGSRGRQVLMTEAELQALQQDTEDIKEE